MSPVDLLKSRYVAPREGVEATIFRHFDAQIGEVGWHSVFLDDRLDRMSDGHAEQMLRLLRDRKRPSVLEVGAYAHHSAHIVAHKTGGLGVSHDISTASLAAGNARAAERGLSGEHVAVAGDFHDLPFSDNSFDLVFVASSVHHTWRPWVVMNEMIRVCRPDGVVHLENEPVGSAAAVYAFRGNRNHSFTPYEAALARLGLTRTVAGPFGDSREETMFGIVENDRIPLWVFEDTLERGGKLAEFTINSQSVMGELEKWMLDKTAPQIAARLIRDTREAAESFSELDRLMGFSVPGPDELWPIAYRVEHAARQPRTDRSLGQLFGAALRATLIKRWSWPRPASSLFTRPTRTVQGVHLDQPTGAGFEIRIENLLAPDAFPAADWQPIEEPYGKVVANTGSTGRIDPQSIDGVMVLRIYSIAQDRPYFFSVQVGDRLVYSHCVAVTESHLAKFMVRAGESVLIHHHDEHGRLVDAGLNSRIVPRFIVVEATAEDFSDGGR